MIQASDCVIDPRILFSFCILCKGCPNKSASFKVRAIVVLLGWRHWKFNICHLSLLRLVVMERCTKEYRVIIVKTHYMWDDTALHAVSSDAMAIRIGHRVCEISCLRHKPQTIPELKTDIRRVFGEIEPQLCGIVIENLVKRVGVWQQSSGTFVGYCVPQLIAVCVLYTEIKISALFE